MNLTIWLTILGMAFVTYGVRVLPLAVVRVKPGPAFEQFLRYVPPAVFAALVFPELIVPNGKFEFGPALVAGFIGVVVAWRTQNMALTILAGIASFALFKTFI
jgi:branched-subunit amino acid transport protein